MQCYIYLTAVALVWSAKAQDSAEPIPYSFSYNVASPESNNYQGHAEYRDELGTTRGAYYHLGPDGFWHKTVYHDEGQGMMSVYSTIKGDFPPAEVSERLFDVAADPGAPLVSTRARPAPVTPEDVQNAIIAFRTPSLAISPRINRVLSMLLFPRGPRPAPQSGMIFFRDSNSPPTNENAPPQANIEPVASRPIGGFGSAASRPPAPIEDSSLTNSVGSPPIGGAVPSEAFDAFDNFFGTGSDLPNNPDRNEPVAAPSGFDVLPQSPPPSDNVAPVEALPAPPSDFEDFDSFF